MSRWWKAASWAPGGNYDDNAACDHRSFTLFCSRLFQRPTWACWAPGVTKGSLDSRPTLATLSPCTLFGEKRLACWADAWPLLGVCGLCHPHLGTLGAPISAPPVPAARPGAPGAPCCARTPGCAIRNPSFPMPIVVVRHKNNSACGNPDTAIGFCVLASISEQLSLSVSWILFVHGSDSFMHDRLCDHDLEPPAGATPT